MHGMDTMSTSFLIDITRPVREAGLLVDKVGLQLMPLTASEAAQSSSTFRVGKVDIVIV
jgi:hypothetical protein